MNIEKLVGSKVEIKYDRHIVHYMESADSDYNTLVGIVEGISDDFILMSYYLERDVQVTKKGLIFDKVESQREKVKKRCLINIRYIIEIDIVD
uniref:hypothetical protein n=1 Tax=Blautia faecicola TaxID=2509240 RepID=UPI003522551F